MEYWEILWIVYGSDALCGGSRGIIASNLWIQSSEDTFSASHKVQHTKHRSEREIGRIPFGMILVHQQHASLA
jgi:hypothetical protein